MHATENFKLGIAAATGGIAILYLINFIMGFFGSGIGIISSNNNMGILFSGFVVVIAALNLFLILILLRKEPRWVLPNTWNGKVPLGY